MKDKEKQIEEMARIIAFDLCPYGKLHAKLYENRAKCASNDNFAECTKINKVVEKLYAQGYRKLPENARVILDTEDQQFVVLSKEELSKRDYEFRQIGYDECLRDNPKKDKYIKTLERKIDQLNAKLGQSSKETADKIIDLIKAFCPDKKFVEVITRIISERLGVEIKE